MSTPVDPIVGLKAAGWMVDRISLYDNEGVEGFIWTSPDGKEYVVIGDWSEAPPAPGSSCNSTAIRRADEPAASQ